MNTFNSAQAKELMALLPRLTFDPLHDSQWTQMELAQAYLNFYAINFAKTWPAVVQGFGVLDSGPFRIATHYWLPQNPRGTLVVVHGYYDHVGLFGKAIAYGLEQGLAVIAFDLPGHGLSNGERAAIDSFDQYRDALEAVLAASRDFLPGPFYGLGQSTGGAILLNYVWHHRSDKEPYFHRIALCAPLILPRGWHVGRFVYAAVRFFIQRTKRTFSLNSHDKSFTDFVQYADCLQEKSLSVVWVGAMKAWHRKFRAFPPLDTHLLVLQGTEDLTVAWQYNTVLIKRKLPKAEIHFIAGAGHQLVNESALYRTDVFTKISQFFFNT